jgi:hypothetical protein
VQEESPESGLSKKIKIKPSNFENYFDVINFAKVIQLLKIADNWKPGYVMQQNLFSQKEKEQIQHTKSTLPKRLLRF